MYFENTILKSLSKEFCYIVGSTGFTYLDDKNTLFGHTSCSFYRNVFSKEILSKLDSKLGAKDEKLYEGDTLRNIINLSVSKGYFKNRLSSIYTFNQQGVWSNKSSFERDRINFYAFSEYSKIFPKHSLSLLLKAKRFGEKIFENKIRSEKTENIKNEDYKNYITNARNINRKINNKDKVTFIFYLPSKKLGGYETCFANAAEYLYVNLGFDVIFIDYPNGISHQLINEKSIKRIHFKGESNFELLNPSIVFFPNYYGL